MQNYERIIQRKHKLAKILESKGLMLQRMKNELAELDVTLKTIERFQEAKRDGQ